MIPCIPDYSLHSMETKYYLHHTGPFPPMSGILPDVDDGVSEPIPIPGGFPFGDARLDTVYVRSADHAATV